MEVSEYLSSFSAAITKHHDQDNLKNKMFSLGLVVPEVSVYNHHSRQADMALRVFILIHKQSRNS